MNVEGVSEIHEYTNDLSRVLQISQNFANNMWSSDVGGVSTSEAILMRMKNNILVKVSTDFVTYDAFKN